MNDVQQMPQVTFDFNGMALNPIYCEGDEILFAANEIARVLGYRDAPNMVRMLDDHEAATHNVSSRSENGVEQARAITVITEPGLYHCILKSRRKEAVEFRNWVTGVVLP